MCCVQKSLVQNYSSFIIMVLYQVLLILSPDIQNIPHRVDPKNCNSTERQMAAHMHTLIYAETVMACVPCFDS